MATILATKESKEIVIRLIRESFDKINFDYEHIYNQSDELIKTANDFGLHDLADDMETDKKSELRFIKVFKTEYGF